MLTLRTRGLWPEPEALSACRLTGDALWPRLRAECRAAQAGARCAWAVIVSHAAASAGGAAAALDAAEHERNERYRSSERRRPFVTGRALVRQVLFGSDARARHAPQFNACGKPRLPGAVHFGLSHTWHHSALAVDPVTSIGIDIESTQRLGETLRLIDLIAHPREAALLRRTSPQLLGDQMLRCWTRKEALLKAWGCGLALSPTLIDARLDEHDPVIEVYGRWRVLDACLGGTSGCRGRDRNCRPDPDRAVVRGRARLAAIGPHPPTARRAPAWPVDLRPGRFMVTAAAWVCASGEPVLIRAACEPTIVSTKEATWTRRQRTRS
jgi:4'-phosphopantetheinyl transferase